MAVLLEKERIFQSVGKIQENVVMVYFVGIFTCCETTSDCICDLGLGRDLCVQASVSQGQQVFHQTKQSHASSSSVSYTHLHYVVLMVCK